MHPGRAWGCCGDESSGPPSHPSLKVPDIFTQETHDMDIHSSQTHDNTGTLIIANACSW